MKNILVLDNITNKINFYNENSIKVRSLSPKKENHLVDTGILYFTFSEREKRIGACL